MRYLPALFLALALPALAVPPTADNVKRWIAQLADDDAGRRDDAERRLAALDESWKSTLTDALAGAPDVESRARLEALVRRLSRPHWRTDVEGALADAKRDGKPVLVLATAGAPDGFS